MPNHNSLASLFTDIANAIRNKTGSSSTIVADNFPDAISAIPTGGGGGGGTDTSDATLTSGSQMLSGYTAYARGTKYTGSISSKSSQTYTPGTSNQTIASGQYLSGTQTIRGDSNLVAGNIKNGTTIFGVTGTYQGSGGSGTDTSDATLTSGSQMLSGYTAYSQGVKYTGSIPIKTQQIYTPGTSGQVINHGQYIGEDQLIQGDANLVAGNIRSGVTIFGVTGTYTGGGGGGSAWTVTNLASPSSLDDQFIAFPATGISGTIGAFILYSTATRTPQSNRVVAICGDSTGSKIVYFSSSGSSFMTSSGVTTSIFGNDIIIDIDNTGLTIADSNYGLVVVHGGSGNLVFRELETTPGGSQTQATFTNVAAAPKIYMCALYPSVSYASAHRVNSVAYMDNTLLTATNFFTNNSYCYSSGFTSTLSGTSLTITSNGQQAGGFFHSDVYKLFYLTEADLGGSA